MIGPPTPSIDSNDHIGHTLVARRGEIYCRTCNEEL